MQTSPLFWQLFDLRASKPGFVGRKGSVARTGGGKGEGRGVKGKGWLDWGGIGTHKIRGGKENSIDDFESVLVVQVRISSV